MTKTRQPWQRPWHPTPVKALPTYDLESELMDVFHGPVVGIDEAGRGPWAGPVVVAAVILDPDRIPEGSERFQGPHR